MILIKYIPYIAASSIFCIGLYGIIVNNNLVKKLLSLSVLQSAVIILFVSFGKVQNGVPPILESANKLSSLQVVAEKMLYANPLPQVLMLTAIVVGLSTLSLGLALVIRIKEEYGTIDDGQITTINLHQDD